MGDADRSKITWFEVDSARTIPAKDGRPQIEFASDESIRGALATSRVAPLADLDAMWGDKGHESTGPLAELLGRCPIQHLMGLGAEELRRRSIGAIMAAQAVARG